MNNIYPANIIQYTIHPGNRDIIKKLRSKATDTCRNIISDEYIKMAFNKVKRGFFYTLENNDDIIGFCIWIEKNEILKNGICFKNLHILLICANYNDYKLGRKILFDVDRYGSENKFEYISLHAANNELVKYYEHDDFHIKDIDTLLMRKKIMTIKQ